MIRRLNLGAIGPCPVVDLASNICDLGGQDVACNLIRECDHLTGATHFEYALPQGNINPNIWVFDGAIPTWNGPNLPNVMPPVIPFLPAPAVPSATVVPVSSPPPPHQPSPIVPAIAPPLVRESAPPPGTNRYPTSTTPFNPRLLNPFARNVALPNPAATVTSTTSTAVNVTNARPNPPDEVMYCMGTGCGPGAPREPGPEFSIDRLVDFGFSPPIAEYGRQLIDQAKGLPMWVWAAAAAALYLSTRKA